MLTTIVGEAVGGDGSSDGHIAARVQGDGVGYAACAAQPAPREQWIHIGINFGPPSFEMFIDGAPVMPIDAGAFFAGGTEPCDETFAGGIAGAGQDWIIGASEMAASTDPGFFFAGGRIDELRISSVRRDFSQ
jgi:hypothetical protein